MTTQMTLFDVNEGAPLPQYTYVFSDGIDRKAMKRAIEHLDSVTDSQGNVHVVFEIDEVPPVSWGAILEKAAHARDLTKLEGRYALVTDKKWLSTLAPLAALVSGLHLRVFDKTELEHAKRWAKAN